MRVVTYSSPSGHLLTLSVPQICVLGKHGMWPKDAKGEEYCTVCRGEHEGEPDMDNAELAAYVGYPDTAPRRPQDPEIINDIPDHTLSTLEGWVQSACPVGGFLDAVLRNDLKGAIARGDQAHLRALPSIVRYLVNYVPANCWGSEERVRAWRGTLVPGGT